MAQHRGRHSDQRGRRRAPILAHPDTQETQSSGERRELSIGTVETIGSPAGKPVGPLISPSATIQMVCRSQVELEPGAEELLGNRWLLCPLLTFTEHMLGAGPCTQGFLALH